jgi:hypothetical protein
VLFMMIPPLYVGSASALVARARGECRTGITSGCRLRPNLSSCVWQSGFKERLTCLLDVLAATAVPVRKCVL